MVIDGRGRKMTDELVAARRQQICDAAVRLFGQKGFHSSTMEGVAGEANVSVGLIYKYFKDKEDLLYLSILGLLEEYAIEIPAAAERHSDPLEKFKAAVHAYAKVIDRRKRAALLGYRAGHALGRERMNVVTKKEKVINKLIGDLIDHCIAEEVFKPVDAEMFTYQVVVFVNSWPLDAWRMPRSSIEQFVDPRPGTHASCGASHARAHGGCYGMSVESLFSLKGKTVFVTGASSGIGLHLAGTFARAGAAVALGARRMDRIGAAVQSLTDLGYQAMGVSLDVTKPDTIRSSFDMAEAQLGGVVDVLINNAGVIYAAPFVEQEPAEIDRVLDTNLRGAMRVAQEAARRMVPLRRGSIVNVASTAGLRAGAFMASYGASKAALMHLSSIMALELAGKNIRVNVICPGNFETDMQVALTDKGFKEPMLRRTPMRRYGQLDELDGPFLLLASDAGRYMTGSVIVVDGGQVLGWM